MTLLQEQEVCNLKDYTFQVRALFFFIFQQFYLFVKIQKLLFWLILIFHFLFNNFQAQVYLNLLVLVSKHFQMKLKTHLIFYSQSNNVLVLALIFYLMFIELLYFQYPLKGILYMEYLIKGLDYSFLDLDFMNLNSQELFLNLMLFQDLIQLFFSNCMYLEKDYHCYN